MTFEANIKAWLELITGYTVVQAPYSGARKVAPYITFQIIGIAPMVDGFKKAFVGADFRRWTQAKITVSVNVYADKGYQKLSDILSANDWQDARIALKDDGVALAFLQGSAPNNLTGLGDSDYRSRWQSDLTMNADLTNDRARYLIDQMMVSGEWATADGGDIIEIEGETDTNSARLDAGIEVTL
jgi:hypothetical protein